MGGDVSIELAEWDVDMKGVGEEMGEEREALRE